MIKLLKIKNFALAKDVEINFEKGFNVLVGETGAGKSIILKSLMFLLGEKFNKSDVRTGENFVRVSGIFTGLTQKTLSVLNKYDLNSSEELLLTRQTDLSGKTDCKVNGETTTLNALKELAETLVDYTGQNENISLLKTANHINILDNYKPFILAKEKQDLFTLTSEFNVLKAQLNKFGGDENSRARLLELLDYQIKEIEGVGPALNEDSDLENRLSSARNAEKISGALQSTIKFLKGGYSATENLKNAEKSLIQIATYDKEYEKYIEKLNSFYYEIEDIAETLENSLGNDALSEFELEKLDSRLDKIKNLKKKYGSTIEQVLAFLEKAQKDKQSLENADEEVATLTLKMSNLEQKIKEKCAILSEKRKKLALELETRLASEFNFLGMKNAKLKVDFREGGFTANGFDNVEFLFSANLGENLKPLSKTISGGEMSRFMLALKNIIAESDGVGTLVLDEIDTGISGEVGGRIAQKLGTLAKNYQIICISHLPQVCAMADTYFFVTKMTENGSTFTRVKFLFNTEIISAIARLSGGKTDSEISLGHATELKNRAENFKKSLQ